MKAGWKTTEFWATVALNIGNIAAAFTGVVPATWATIVSAVSVGAYAIARGLAKSTSSV